MFWSYPLSLISYPTSHDPYLIRHIPHPISPFFEIRKLRHSIDILFGCPSPSLTFADMQFANVSGLTSAKTELVSTHLNREVKLDVFLSRLPADPADLRLLLINDGQNLEEMGFAAILEKFDLNHPDVSLLCVGIHANSERRREYGVAGHPDYNGRGDKAKFYHQFIIDELIPFIMSNYNIHLFRECAFAGFSLGGLMALDIAWKHPGLFNSVGVFSGSLWWRNVEQDDEGYDDDKHRIMHQEIRNGYFIPGLKFYFQCGNMDETKDRNKNGIIDSIDDTLDLIKELEAKGYSLQKDIMYSEMTDGRHDIPTWGRAMPEFLEWSFGK
jgi:predicted alpha/beta superfamily hydrolase